MFHFGYSSLLGVQDQHLLIYVIFLFVFRNGECWLAPGLCVDGPQAEQRDRQRQNLRGCHQSSWSLEFGP